MSDVKVELNLKGINEVMKSSGIQSACAEAARAVGNASGIDFEIESKVINWIAIAVVKPASREAYQENFEENSLIKGATSAGLSFSK